MKIGEMAARAGVSVRMLRYYEEQDLLTPARTDSGYRDYAADDVATARRIRMLSASGMTLPVIKQFLPCAIEGRGAFEPCDELAAILRHHIDDADRALGDIAERRALLAGLLVEIDTRTD